MKRVYDVLQGTEEWHALRRGILTASQVNQILTPKKLEPAKGEQVRKLACQMAVDRIYGYPQDYNFCGYHMERGKMEEPFAIEEYEKRTGKKVERIGFATNKFGVTTIGCSPDGGVTKDGRLLEVKSRINREQMRVFLLDEMPDDFRLQVQCQLMVCELEVCDFISFSNGMPLLIKSIEADNGLHDAIKQAAYELELQVVAIMQTYQEKVRDLPCAPYRDYAGLFEIQGT